MSIFRTVSWWAIVSALTVPSLLAQQASRVPLRITQGIDETKLVTFRGNTYPLAQAKYDQGAVPQDLRMERILLLLSRSPEQEAALQQLLQEQQDPGSFSYHAWLTPGQFGEQFGPAPEDIDKITGWLKSQGFRVDEVANGRGVVEFSGTAAQVERGFHTPIHSYLINGEQHWANARDPQIPAALSPVVAGIVSLHNFPIKSMHHTAGAFLRTSGDAAWVPASPAPKYTTMLGGYPEYAVAPYDFATIYNVLPLWSAGIDGTGQTIAVVGRSNIAIQDVRNFRSAFGLPAHDPVITLNGPDPGTSNVDWEFENALDVEWAGSVAKGATIDLVVSPSTATDGSVLSSEYIVDNDVAPVLSSSYGSCELAMTSLNQLYNSLWQQAAGEGITVVVAAGDGGSGLCDEYQDFAVSGLQVDGMASTPYDVAVGGTDFADGITGNESTYWNSSNTAGSLASAKSYIPEMPWNDSCASPEIVSALRSSTPEALCNSSEGQPFLVVTAGGGGVSSLYPKPSWQSGVNGIPNDGQRDLPDVSLFAGDDGTWGHAYVVCQSDNGGACSTSGPNGFVAVLGYGDSFGAPAFAGIMAIINQKTASRQGLANPNLYKLAATEYGSSNSPNTAGSQACNTSAATPPSSSCIFYDVTDGDNDVPCLTGSTNCYTSLASDTYGLLSTSSNFLLPAYPAGTGYDLATGLGSVNVANLVNKWQVPLATAPVLSVSKTHAGNFAQGQNGATYTVTVSNSPSAASTTAAVTVTETVPVGLTLVSMAGSGWTCAAPTCTRSDALAASASYPAIAVTVNVASNAPSQVTNQVTVSGGGSVSATANDVTTITTGSTTTPTTMTLSASPSTIATTGSTTLTASLGVIVNVGPTGTVTFDLGSAQLGSASVSWAGGTAQAIFVVYGSQLAVGTNTITAYYSGNASFAGSSASVVVTVTQPATTSGYTISTVAGDGQYAYSGDGGPAISAQFSSAGIAVDSAGDIFITDYYNNRIRKVTPAGIITTVAGNGIQGFSGDGGPARAAELNDPGGVAVDGAGNLFIADQPNNRIRKVTPAGIITTVAGNGTGGFSGDNEPATSAELNLPAGVVVDGSGNLIIPDFANSRVRKVTPAGIITTVAGNGNAGFGGDGGPATSAELNLPNCVRLDSAGNYFIADFGNNRIRKVTPAGIISTVAGNGTAGYSGDNGPATMAELYEPACDSVDSAGNIFIADSGNSVIRMVTPAGTISTVAGNGTLGFGGDGGPATSAELDLPLDVVPGGAGDLFIADYNRIRKLVPPPSAAPSISSAGVLNSASYAGGPVSPGEIVSIFGTAIGPASPSFLTLDSTGKVSTSIGGVTVSIFDGSFNYYLAPLTYVSSTQINAVVPYEVAGIAQPTLQVTYAGQASNQIGLQVAPTAPAIFTDNGSGTGPGAILNQDYSLNTQQNPASAGSVVQIFMTGEGLTTPVQADGAVTTANTSGLGPITPAPQQAVSVKIGDQKAKLDFAGEAPDFVAGVLQVDAEVPAGLSSGANSIAVQVGTQTSQSGVTVWVQ